MGLAKRRRHILRTGSISTRCTLYNIYGVRLIKKYIDNAVSLKCWLRFSPKHNVAARNRPTTSSDLRNRIPLADTWFGRVGNSASKSSGTKGTCTISLFVVVIIEYRTKTCMSSLTGQVEITVRLKERRIYTIPCSQREWHPCVKLHGYAIGSQGHRCMWHCRRTGLNLAEEIEKELVWWETPAAIRLAICT